MTYDEEKKVASIVEGLLGHIEKLRGEILRLETELALSKPVYSRRQLEARAEAAEAEVKLIREAASELLNQAEHVCLGAHTPLNIKEAARNLADPIAKVQTALASTGGEHHAE